MADWSDQITAPSGDIYSLADISYDPSAFVFSTPDGQDVTSQITIADRRLFSNYDADAFSSNLETLKTGQGPKDSSIADNFFSGFTIPNPLTSVANTVTGVVSGVEKTVLIGLAVAVAIVVAVFAWRKKG